MKKPIFAGFFQVNNLPVKKLNYRILIQDVLHQFPDKKQMDHYINAEIFGEGEVLITETKYTGTYTKELIIERYKIYT